MLFSCAGFVLQTLQDLSCHALWLQCMSKCQGEWCQVYPAAQDQLQPVLHDLKLKRALSSSQLATINRLYSELPVRQRGCYSGVVVKCPPATFKHVSP